MRIKELTNLEKSVCGRSSKRCVEKRIDYKKCFQRMLSTYRREEESRGRTEKANHKRKFEDSSLIRQKAKRQKINRCINFDEETRRMERLSGIEENIVKSSKVLEMMSFVEENTPEEKPVVAVEENNSQSLLPCVLVVMPMLIGKDECVHESPKKRSDEAITKKKKHKLEDRAVQDQIRNMILNFSELVLNDNTPKKDKNYVSCSLQDLDILQLISKYINLKNDKDLQQIRIEFQNYSVYK